MTITVKEIAARTLLAVAVVLFCTVLGAAIGSAAGALLGFGPAGFLVGAFVGAFFGAAFVLDSIWG